MISLWEACYARAVVAVGSQLASYPPGGNTPGIFLDDQVPGDAARPYVWSPPATHDIPFDTKDQASWGGREISRDWVGVVDRATAPRVLLALLETLRFAFHRQRFPVADAAILIATVTGPIPFPSDATVRALALTTTFTLTT